MLVLNKQQQPQQHRQPPHLAIQTTTITDIIVLFLSFSITEIMVVVAGWVALTETVAVVIAGAGLPILVEAVHILVVAPHTEGVALVHLANKLPGLTFEGVKIC